MESSEYTNLAVYMVKHFISPKTNTLLIREYCTFECHSQENNQQELLNNIVFDLKDEFGILFFMDYYVGRLFDYNMFIVDSSLSFMYIRYSFPTIQHDRFFSFYILLTWIADNDDEHKGILHEIFLLCLSYKVRNVIIMSRTHNGNHISFYEYELSKSKDCEDEIIIRELNRYDNGTLQNQYLFREYTNDFHGCLINVSAHEMPPILSFDGDVNNETHLIEINRLGGIEGELLKTVADVLKIKIRLKFPKEISVINRLYFSLGCFEDLDMERSQIAIGGFSSTQRNSEKYSTSLAYYTSSYVFVVRSDLGFSPLDQLLNPLYLSTWIFLLIIFSILIIFIKIVQTQPKVQDFVFGPRNKIPIYSMFAIFMGILLPTHVLPKRNFARFLLASWLLISFQVRNGYQGKIFNSLRYTNRIAVPQTISHLIKQDYSLLSTSYNEFYTPSKQHIIPNKSNLLDMLQRSTSKVTVITLLDSLTNYNYINSNTSTLSYVKEAIHSFPSVMYFQKHSLLRASVDKKLKIFIEAGITSYIAQKHVQSKFQSMNTRSQCNYLLINLRG
ncbi:hypothetical protein CVS40_9367 [Lucilia cuprina]|nr:hypothetical protein CVS40_9367 [Lucilia cuprina]